VCKPLNRNGGDDGTRTRGLCRDSLGMSVFSSLGFALKTGERLRIAGQLLRQEFERDKTMEARVLGFIDHAHAATPEFLDDAVVRNGLANH
jgi:hypothetical protein